MITDIHILRVEGGISIHTATDADKDDYIALELEGELLQSLVKTGAEKNIDVRGIIWDERYKSDCIMFAIVEDASSKTIGFCEIENVSSNEPTIGITISAEFRGKGYGYLAAKMMIEEGWRIFSHSYFVWELEPENIASKKLILKLGGKRMINRSIFSEKVIKAMKENGIEIDLEVLSNSIERYKIERP